MARSSPNPAARRRRIAGGLVALALAGSVAGRPPAGARADASLSSLSRLLEPDTASLLADEYEAFLRDQDLDAFRRGVMLRFPEATLCRLARGGAAETRRAAVLGLGLVGSMRANSTVGEALGDRDPVVRNFAQAALWSIWFRAGTPEQNARLERIRGMIASGDLREAEEQAGRLIEDAPDFAEAHNQRAIAAFFQGRFADSAADCRKVLELNPYHTGALDGLAQCYLNLGERERALETFRRSLKIQPYNDRLRRMILRLEEAPE